MKIAYREMKGLGGKNKERLRQINDIIDDYAGQGLRLTLRQLYYRLVVKNIIANKRTEYQNLSVLLREGRMCGIVDWDAIEDRIRSAVRPSSWLSASNGMDAIISQYREDRQEGQDTNIEVWVEKDAISEVLKRVTNPLGVRIMVNRGYGSVTSFHDAYNRFRDQYYEQGQNTTVLYLGDFDPSGLDMIRDIRGRIQEFIDGGDCPDLDFEIKPIALTSAQIKRYALPPNPAKMADPRAEEYVKKYGKFSWEVDALEPSVLDNLLRTEITNLMDMDVYNAVLESEKAAISNLERVKNLL